MPPAFASTKGSCRAAGAAPAVSTLGRLVLALLMISLSSLVVTLSTYLQGAHCRQGDIITALPPE